MIDKIYHIELAKTIRKWFSVPEHYSILHFSVEVGLSKKKLFALGAECPELQDAIDYALTVQEWKISEGMLTGVFKEYSGLRMLEVFNGWVNKQAIAVEGNLKTMVQIFRPEKYDLKNVDEGT